MVSISTSRRSNARGKRPIVASGRSGAVPRRDASDPVLAGQYDLAMALECVHDMSNPIGALRTMRRLVGERGTVLIADERVGDRFTAKGNDVEWMMYGWSVLHCLPVGMVDQPSAGTGTVMRTDTLRGYASEAGLRASRFCRLKISSSVLSTECVGRFLTRASCLLFLLCIDLISRSSILISTAVGRCLMPSLGDRLRAARRRSSSAARTIGTVADALSARNCPFKSSSFTARAV
jgi:hypothetical protein